MYNGYYHGDGLGWHFDLSEFGVNLVLQEPSGGGTFDYNRTCFLAIFTFFETFNIWCQFDSQLEQLKLTHDLAFYYANNSRSHSHRCIQVWVQAKEGQTLSEDVGVDQKGNRSKQRLQ
jgi:hypothetical protein